MTTKTCAGCGDEKPLSSFRNDRRGEDGKASTCIGCPGKKAGGGKVKREPEPEADAGLEQGPALSIAPGLGLTAWIENGCLQLSQGDDVVALSPTEAKVVFAQFAEWAAT